jgi:hypothetical protein
MSSLAAFAPACNIIHEHFGLANFILCTSLSGRWSHAPFRLSRIATWKFHMDRTLLHITSENNNPTLGWGTREKRTKGKIAFQKRVKCVHVTIYMNAHYTIPNWDHSSFPNHLFFKKFAHLSAFITIWDCYYFLDNRKTINPALALKRELRTDNYNHQVTRPSSDVYNCLKY